MSEDLEKLLKYTKILYIIIINLFVLYGLITIFYLNKPLLSLIFLIPLILISIFYAALFSKYNVQYENKTNIIERKQIWRAIFSFIMGFSVLPIVNLMFNDSINTKIIILSLLNGIFFIFMPYLILKL